MKITLLPLLTTLLMRFYNVSAQILTYVPSNILIGYWGFNNSEKNGNTEHGTPQNVILTTNRFATPNSVYHSNSI